MERKGSIGFIGILQIVFIVLKLCKVIDWSWAWVLSPVIISATLLIAFLIVAVTIYIIRGE